MLELYRAVWRVSAREQLVLILLSLIVAGLAAVPLKFQQLAINGLVEHGEVRRLFWLCAGFLAAVLASAAAKLVLGLRLAAVSEHVVLRIRERLYRNQVADAAREIPRPARAARSWPCWRPRPRRWAASPAPPCRRRWSRSARWQACSPSSP